MTGKDPKLMNWAELFLENSKNKANYAEQQRKFLYPEGQVFKVSYDTSIKGSSSFSTEALLSEV